MNVLFGHVTISQPGTTKTRIAYEAVHCQITTFHVDNNFHEAGNAL